MQTKIVSVKHARTKLQQQYLISGNLTQQELFVCLRVLENETLVCQVTVHFKYVIAVYETEHNCMVKIITKKISGAAW